MRSVDTLDHGAIGTWSDSNVGKDKRTAPFVRRHRSELALGARLLAGFGLVVGVVVAMNGIEVTGDHTPSTTGNAVEYEAQPVVISGDCNDAVLLAQAAYVSRQEAVCATPDAVVRQYMDAVSGR